MSIQYLHTMVRVSDIDASLKFFCDGLGLTEVSRMDSEAGRFTEDLNQRLRLVLWKNHPFPVLLMACHHYLSSR